MHPPSRIRFSFQLPRIIGLLALAAVLGACSTVKFAYNSLDEIALWWLDGYVDFTDAQEQRARDELRRLQQWHRTEELPRVAGLLRRMEEVAPNPVTPEQVCAFVPPLRERLQAVVDRAEPAVVAILADIESNQITHLEKKYAKNNADFRKQWLRPDLAERREKQAEQLVDRAETLYGNLGREQRAVIEQQVARSVFDPGKLLAERLRRQQDAIETMRKIASRTMVADESRALLRGYLQRTLASPDPAYRAQQDALLSENCRSFAAIHNSTTAAQREHAVKRLRGWQRDVLELAGKP